MAAFTKADYENVMNRLNTNQGLPPKINPSAKGLPNPLPRPSGIKSHTKGKGGGTKMVVDPAQQAVAAVAGRGKARTPQIASPTGPYALGKGPQLTNSQTAVGDVGLKTAQGLNAMTAWGNTLGGMETPAANQSLVPGFMQGVEGGATPPGLAISTTGGQEEYVPMLGNAIEGAKPYDASLVGTTPAVAAAPEKGPVLGKAGKKDKYYEIPRGQALVQEDTQVGTSQQIIDQLIAKQNAGIDADIRRERPDLVSAMRPQATEQPQGGGGIAAADIVKHLTTSGPATGPFGKQAAPPSSARLSSPLVGPERSLADVERESGAIPSIDSIARQYSGGNAPGPAATAMATRIRNNMVADKVRAQRADEKAAAAALETQKAGSTQKLQNAQAAKLIAESEAIQTPAEKQAFAKKLATDKNLFDAMEKILTSGLQEAEQAAALEQLYALSVGEKVVTESPAVEYDDGGIFGSETLAQPAITRREKINKGAAPAVAPFGMQKSH
jgi:hypothetical protein